MSKQDRYVLLTERDVEQRGFRYMDVIYKNERLKYVEDYYGEPVLWITSPNQIGMEHMRFVGGYPNEYCIYLSDLSVEEKADIERQLKK